MPSRVFLVSGGGDAIDTAAKLARRYWSEIGSPERTILISRTAGYHGTHGFGTAIGGIPANREGFGPLVESVQVAHDSLDGDARDDRARSGRSASRRCSSSR